MKKLPETPTNAKKCNVAFLLIFILAIALSASSCGEEPKQNEGQTEGQTEDTLSIDEIATGFEPEFPADIPEYSGEPFVVMNGNNPYFTKTNLPTDSFEYYSDLDELGRCGVACANVGQDLMPTEDRGDIEPIKPSGWHTVKYDNIDGNYLYNRCHLIGYQLSSENANEKNLITGTRYLNTEGMLPFEIMVADYVKETGNHVLYRVTPVFDDGDLLAYGVLMEGWSVEDEGDGICFNVFVYNIQPDIVIDYANGDSYQNENAAGESDPSNHQEPTEQLEPAPVSGEYILNTNTHKFHYPTCESVEQMAEKNKQSYSGSRDDVISMGYDPCKGCNP